MYTPASHNLVFRGGVDDIAVETEVDIEGQSEYMP
jgi:hypothetical protein